MARNKGTHHVITANRTQDGAIVYMRADGSWTEVLAQAHPVETDAEQRERLDVALQQERFVCDPYAFSVNVEEGRPVSLTARETIREAGPTIPYGRHLPPPPAAKRV